MLRRAIVCSDCGEAVPYGRLSCPSCGALLASVAGGRGPASVTSDLTSVPVPDGRSVLADDDDEQNSLWSGHVVAPTGPGAYLPPAVDTAPPPPTSGVAPPTPSVLTPVQALPAGTPRQPPATTDQPTLPGAHRLGVADRWSELEGLDSGLDHAAAIGGALVAFGLVLPWSSTVIGASGVASYFDKWGLAGPAHVLVLAAAVAVTVLAALPSRIPTWIGTGLASLSLGMFVLGLLWPYAIGPLGAALGSLVALIGALILIVVGILVVARGRHAPAPPDV